MRHFEELEDPRSEVNLRHSLVSVVVISLMAVLADAAGPSAIARWATFKAEQLSMVLPLPYGIPQKDVYRRVLCTLKPDAFQVCFVSWLQSLRAEAAATGRNNRSWRWTARFCGAVMIGRTTWTRCTPSRSGLRILD